MYVYAYVFNHAFPMLHEFIHSLCQTTNMDRPNMHIDHMPDTVEKMRKYNDE